MDTMTKAFISVFDDRPENPTERLLEILSETSRELPSNYMTKLEKAEIALAEARTEIDVLRKQLAELGVEPAVPSKQPNTISANVSHHPTPAKVAPTVSSSATNTTPPVNAATLTGAIPKETQAGSSATASAAVTTVTSSTQAEASPESAKTEIVEKSDAAETNTTAAASTSSAAATIVTPKLEPVATST